MNLNLNFPNPTWNETMLYKLITNEGLSDNERKKYSDFLTEIEGLKQSKLLESELLAITNIMAVVDHGTYLLEPCCLVEIIGLWQELYHLWQEDDRTVTHRP
ncbi:MAG: hypothetical protein N2482_03120 [Patescibacteria group bacterium]|nr:hypothetical protein [Patescibacteria group bacterium]